MGSNMVRYLLNTYPDYEVLNFDKLTYAGNLENLRDVEQNSRYHFVQGDIADDAAVEKAFTDFQPDVVLNYAAETHVDRSIMDPKAFLMTNVIGTYTLLEAVRKFGTGRYVQVSTDEVFGSIDNGHFTEASPFEPNSPYSAAKAGGDLLCRGYVKTYDAPVIVTHSCNFFGPFQFPEKFIPLFITNLIEEKKVPLYGTGLNVREWIFTQDHCRAIDRVLHDGRLGEVYNIGTGSSYSNIDIVKKILSVFEKGEEMIEYVSDRPGHDLRYAVDATKIQTELDWKPAHSFDEELAATVEWYRAHQEWWQPLKSGEHAGYFTAQYRTRP